MMKLLFESFVILSTLIHFKGVLVSEFQPQATKDQTDANEVIYQQPKDSMVSIETLKKELKPKNETLETNSVDVSKEVNHLLKDALEKLNIGPLEQSINLNNPIRNTRSITNSTQLRKSQFEQLCTSGFAGTQPCTCYYPDHPNVPIFQLDTDEITTRASSINGSGPSNCEELKNKGYSLNGFYLARFNTKRVKAIYCEFSRKNEDKGLATKSSARKIDESASPEVLQFCDSVGNQPCKFIYPDYPDIPLMYFKSKKMSTRSNLLKKHKRPASCEDLHDIGYYLKGFYLVSVNAKLVKIVFCDFDKTIEDDKIEKQKIGTKKPTSNESNLNHDSRSLPHCNRIGSRPCSCYYSSFPDILQFELGNDQVTILESSEHGTGPQNCEELKNIGYTLDGFYMVRFKVNIIKMVYCMFNYIEQEEENQMSTIKPTLKPSRTVKEKTVNTDLTMKPSNKKYTKSTIQTTSKPNKKNMCDKVSHLRNLKNDFCLNTIPTIGYPKSLPNQLYCILSDWQQWVLRNGTHLCSFFEDLCFTVNSFSLSLMPYDESLTSQQWKIDYETNRIVNIASNLCLTDETRVYLPMGKSVGVARCNNRNDGQEWAFQSMLFDGFFKCAKYSVSNKAFITWKKATNI